VARHYLRIRCSNHHRRARRRVSGGKRGIVFGWRVGASIGKYAKFNWHIDLRGHNDRSESSGNDEYPG
jgi:hypothetical protein